MAHDHLDCREACAPWVLKNLTEVTKLVVWDSVMHVTVTAVKDISLSTAVLQGKKRKLTTRHLKKKKKAMSWKHPPSTPASKFNATCIGKEYHDNCLLGPHMCASWLRCNCRVLGGYRRPFLAKHAGCCARMSSFCTTPDPVILPGLVLPCYGATAGRLLEHPPHFRSRAR